MFIQFYYCFILRKQHLFEKNMSGMRDVFLANVDESECTVR